MQGDVLMSIAMQEQTPETNLDDVIDVPAFIERYSQFTGNQIRWMIQNRKKNGLADSCAAIKIGKKWYLNVPVFTRWVTQQS